MRCRRGQTILEYTIIVGIVVVMLSFMGTGIKRGVQSLVKVTADQVGNQQNSDQDFNDTQQGYMVSSNSATQESTIKQVNELGSNRQGNVTDITSISVSESTDTQSVTITNAGFTPSN